MAETFRIGGTNVQIMPSARAKRLVLRATPDGVKISKPKFVSYSAAKRFAHLHKVWIEEHAFEKPLLKNGDTIGKRHKLVIRNGKSNTVSITENEVEVTINRSSNDQAQFIERACLKALRATSRELLEAKVENWGERMSVRPNSLRVRTSKTRWGSCSSKNNLNFSVFVAQLNDDLLDYIVVHELAHIKQKNHSQKFWAEVGSHLPNYKDLRKRLKAEPLTVMPG